MSKKEIVRMVAETLTRDMMDQGKIIEAGWIALREVAIPKDASQAQLDDMRAAFFAGAAHLFSSIMSILEEGEDATAGDLRRLDLIHRELEQFEKQFLQRTRKAGHA